MFERLELHRGRHVHRIRWGDIEALLFLPEQIARGPPAHGHGRDEGARSAHRTCPTFPPRRHASEVTLHPPVEGLLAPVAVRSSRGLRSAVVLAWRKVQMLGMLGFDTPLRGLPPSPPDRSPGARASPVRVPSRGYRCARAPTASSRHGSPFPGLGQRGTPPDQPADGIG